MIAADTSAWVDYFKGVDSKGVRFLEQALSDGTLMMPLPVAFEVLSGPGLTKVAEEAILELPRLEILEGFWERSAILRKRLLQKGMKAHAMDCLIAQTCIDHDIPLITADYDYRHFQKAGLKLL